MVIHTYNLLPQEVETGGSGRQSSLATKKSLKADRLHGTLSNPTPPLGRRRKPQLWEDNSEMKCLQRKREDLSLEPQDPHKAGRGSRV